MQRESFRGERQPNVALSRGARTVQRLALVARCGSKAERRRMVVNVVGDRIRFGAAPQRRAQVDLEFLSLAGQLKMRVVALGAREILAVHVLKVEVRLAPGVQVRV